ncbi:MAG: gliding motility-associated C-terminal domain-containing protein [Lewinella sp.]|nr:gliding motility-associated C-terminal domain-containing protein [Lewinella sp.]
MRLTLLTTILLGAGLLLSAPAEGQGLRRSVIGSTGASYTTPAGARLRATVAQPPGAGTVQNASHYLRQGFQQPDRCAGAPRARFAIQPEGDPLCGGPYSLVYLDEPDPQTTFMWDFGFAAVPGHSQASNPTGLTYLNPGPRTIQLTVTTDDCIDTVSVDLMVPAAPLAATENRLDLLCREDADGTIDLYVTGGTEPYIILWSTGATGPTVTDLVPGTYAYNLQDANGCLLADTVAISGPDSLLATLLVTDESCLETADGRIQVMAGGGTPPYDYDWDDLAAGDLAADLGAGTYALTLRDANGCARRLQATVENACEQLAFYEVITPNGDGQNETWWIEGIELFPDNRVEIYDRWGRLVYERAAYSNTWAGRDQAGVELPAGTYFYILWLNDPSGARRTGAITLLR